MDEAEIYAQLEQIFRDVFMRDELCIDGALSAADLEGWDSIKQIELLIAVEERFVVKFKAKEIDGMKNVGDLVNAIVGAKKS